MPKYTPRVLPPKEEIELREAVNGQSDLAAKLDYISMMADVDLEMMNVTDEEAEDEAQ